MVQHHNVSNLLHDRLAYLQKFNIAKALMHRCGQAQGLTCLYLSYSPP